MKSQILVPLDGSPLAEQVLPCAMMLGQGLPAELVFFHAVSVSPSARGKSAAAEQVEAQASEYLQGVVDEMHKAGLSTRYVVQHGPAAESIVDYAEQADVHQIVMSTHGYTGILRWTHGSVAERVLQASSVPVLMVQTRKEPPGDLHKPMQCQHILVPLDGSQTAEQVLPSAALVARAVGAQICLFQVPIVQPATSFGGEWFFLPTTGEFDEDERQALAYLEGVAEGLRDKGLQVSTATQIGPVAESIIEYAEANQVDLIAMCTHGRTGLARWAMGSVADRVLHAGSLPILLVRAR